MVRRGILVFLIAGMSLVAWGCEHPISPPAPEAVIPRQPAQSDTRKIIYLDISLSMKGFAIPGSQYDKSLWELRTFLENRDTPVYLVGNQIQQNASGAALIADAGRNQDLYTADQDNLAAGIARFHSPNNQLANAPTPAASPLSVKDKGAKPEIHILITDAVQSLFEQSPNEGCGWGSDWICVKQEMQALLDKGWAGCVIAVRSQFDGFIFPERNGRRERFWYRSDMENLNTFRPFYFFMFSPSAEVLAPFSAKVQESFRQHLMDKSFEVIELTSLSPVSPVNVNSEHYDRSASLSISREQKKTDSSLQDYSRVTVRSDVESVKPNNFILKFGAKVPAEAEVTWKLARVYYSNRVAGRKATDRDDSLRYADLTLVAHNKPVEQLNVKSNGGTFSVDFQVDWPVDSGTAGWSVYRLDGFIKSEDPMLWVHEWSTEDDTIVTHANKTLFLNRLLGELWNASPLKLQRRMAELYLWVGPKEN